jgi:hypothetical protein
MELYMKRIHKMAEYHTFDTMVWLSRKMFVCRMKELDTKPERFRTIVENHMKVLGKMVLYHKFDI